jgi:hypothetical protein
LRYLVSITFTILIRFSVLKSEVQLLPIFSAIFFVFFWIGICLSTQYIVVCYFLEQKNPNGQALLASTIAPHPNQGPATHGASGDMPFGRLDVRIFLLLHLLHMEHYILALTMSLITD